MRVPHDQTVTCPSWWHQRPLELRRERCRTPTARTGRRLPRNESPTRKKRRDRRGAESAGRSARDAVAALMQSALDAVRAIPAAAVLPLLVAIARGTAQPDVAIDYLPAMGLRVDVAPA